MEDLVMKIDNRVLNYTINQNHTKSITDENSKVEGKQTVDDSKAGAKNELKEEILVNFSRESKEAKLIQDVISDEPDVRHDKIAEIKAKIESDNYRINHDAVADNIVDEAIDELF